VKSVRKRDEGALLGRLMETAGLRPPFFVWMDARLKLGHNDPN